jgi:hypothetical protein
MKPEEKKEISGEAALTPLEAMVGPNESKAMPAEGREKDPSHPPPKNPPEEVKPFPVTTNRNVEGQVTYEEEPPTHGDHAPSWQKCGFYSSPIQNERAVHSMDHRTVWVTYRPELLTEQVNILRGLAREEYVLLSSYPGLYAPVVASQCLEESACSRRDQRSSPATVRGSVPTQRDGTALRERMRERRRGARVVGPGRWNRSVVIDPRFRG